jgi:ornithine cyclodeaminase
MQMIDTHKLMKILNKVGLLNFFDLVLARLEKDFANWDQFTHGPRHATHVPDGVIELMPTCDGKYYSVKYVNGHPKNVLDATPCVMALGLLARVSDGMPLMFTEMTFLTAIRTACTSALVAKFAANKTSSKFGIIGTGAQAEFQILAFSRIFNLSTITGFDIDSKAMHKTKENLSLYGIDFICADNIQDVIQNADILTTATAAKVQDVIIEPKNIPEGCHINAIGGDCPGKTELDLKNIASKSIIIEYLPQTKIEGEIQQLSTFDNVIELHNVIRNKQSVRSNAKDITVFDSVGYALEDYSILRVLYELCLEYEVAEIDSYLPILADPKNLFSMITKD